MRQRHIYAAIREAHEKKGYPIELACELLHVARSAYHKWASGKLSQRAAENERLADTIEKIHEESPDKGYRRLNDDLRHDHVSTSMTSGCSASAGPEISVPRSSTTTMAARGERRTRSILPKTFWTGSFMPQSPMKSGLPM